MLRDDKMVDINGNRLQMRSAHKNDKQIADQVRMLMRNDLNHEMVCVVARDRIMYLSELVAEAREMLAQVGGDYPPSRPMSSAPDDGTYVLLQGPEGKAVCRWAGGGATNNPVVMALRGPGGAGYWQCYGSAMAFRNPGRWWPLPEDI